jgi:hypothetical protein
MLTIAVKVIFPSQMEDMHVCKPGVQSFSVAGSWFLSSGLESKE